MKQWIIDMLFKYDTLWYLAPQCLRNWAWHNDGAHNNVIGKVHE